MFFFSLTNKERGKVLLDSFIHGFDFATGGLILEPNPIVSGEFENIPTRNCRWLSGEPD
jgi:hypothetical protein